LGSSAKKFLSMTQNNKLKIHKLDRRHKGCLRFSHYITYSYGYLLNDKLLFYKLREWCWNNFGPGLERDAFIELVDSMDEKPVWAWHVYDDTKRIYFVSEKEFSWFMLKWKQEE